MSDRYKQHFCKKSPVILISSNSISIPRYFIIQKLVFSETNWDYDCLFFNTF